MAWLLNTHTLNQPSPHPPPPTPTHKRITQSNPNIRQQVAWLLDEGPEEAADPETLTDAVEQFGVEEDVASRILEAEFKSAARQVGG